MLDRNEEFNVISMFDGKSGVRHALDEMKVNVRNYYASEIDKPAMNIAQKNYPNTIQLGSVTELKNIDWKSENIHLVVGGSPCQGFSFAGKQLNFEDPRSKLFFEFVRVLREIQVVNPDVKFLLENVKMKKEYEKVISEHLGVEPIPINSARVSAQNRKRLYWTNIEGVTQPEDLGIMLKDIVHENEGKPLSENELNYMLKSSGNWSPSTNNRFETYLNYPDKKSHILTASFSKGVPYNCLFEELEKYIVPFEKTLQILDKEVEHGKVGYFRKDSQANRVYYIHGKAVTLCGSAGGGAAKMGQYLFGCITPDRINKKQNSQRFSEGKKFYTLTAQDRHGILIEGYIRKLTPIECERLQTYPDNYTEGVSDTQRYKMLGNGMTSKVIQHILQFMFKPLQ